MHSLELCKNQLVSSGSLWKKAVRPQQQLDKQLNWIRPFEFARTRNSNKSAIFDRRQNAPPNIQVLILFTRRKCLLISSKSVTYTSAIPKCRRNTIRRLFQTNHSNVFWATVRMHSMRVVYASWHDCTHWFRCRYEIQYKLW